MKYLILKLTNNCNLRCKYCYANLSSDLDGDISNRNMDFETAKKAIDYLLSIDNNLKIQFTGGEPLLNFELLKKIVEYCNNLNLQIKNENKRENKRENKINKINKLNKLNNKKYNIKFAIQTNGTIINSEIIEFIKKFKIGLGISLDDLNNEFRVYANEKPCKIDVLKNMTLLKQNGVHFGITSVITSKNMCETILEELIIYLLSLEVHSISFDFLKLKNKDEFDNNGIFEPEYEDFIKLINKLGAKKYPISIKNLNRKNNNGNSNKYCYLNSGDLLYVNEVGNIYACPTLEGIDNMYFGTVNDLNNNFKLPKFNSKGCFARYYLKNI
ncbi:radical SAM protein [Methanococcus voltae]|uniref:Radical SAM domain protein n=1 Tax=Methanococcus voltae (strain ATCC BAA-1334 / A3) TaxID=456320 RepID=D7DT77_METV3|nr:radical SAM protein [Methanococcus voltae]MCS3901187.1 uncharacterized protein [Methanococcus voltae]